MDEKKMELSAVQVVDLVGLLGGLTDYVRKHVCAAHLGECVSLLHDVTLLDAWFKAKGVEVFGTEVFSNAIKAYTAEQEAQASPAVDAQAN